MDNIFLVWYEEGSYTQRRFLVKGEENAQKEVDRLNQEYGIENPEDSIEYWKMEPIDFKPW